MFSHFLKNFKKKEKGKIIINYKPTYNSNIDSVFALSKRIENDD